MMLRIAHRIASAGENDLPVVHMVKQAIPLGMHVLVCDNVAEYVEAEAKHDCDLTVFPGVVPPWNWTLFEWAVPQGQVERWRTTPSTKPVEAQMMAMLTHSIPLTKHEHVRQEDMTQCDSYRDGGELREHISVAHWRVTQMPMIVTRGILCGLQFASASWLDGDGNVIASKTLCEPDRLTPAEQACAAGVSHAMLAVVMCASSIANCKNVTTIDSTAEDAPPAKWQRRMKTPEIRYSRIKIDGFTSEAKTQGGGIDGHSKAWHICRGNFATYTDAKPLFGKYTGRYWRPQHVKGDKKHGEVHSTHEIGKPTT